MNKSLVVYILILMLSGCASVNAGVDYDRSVEFSKYETAAWEIELVIVAPDSAPVSSLTAKRIMTAVETQMSHRGLDIIDDAESADILMAVIVGARDKVVYEKYPSLYNSSSSWCGANCYIGEYHPHVYTEGTLSIDWFDSFTGEPILHGWAIKTITNDDRQHPQESIEEVVEAVFATFPIPRVTR